MTTPRELHLDDEEERIARSAVPFERDDTPRPTGSARWGNCPEPWYAKRPPRPRAPQQFPRKKPVQP